MSDGVAPELTRDSLFNGRLTCRQHRHGYRFSVDAVLLAHFFKPRPDENILDLGTGCGVIPLILAYRWPKLQVTGLELQPRLVELACRNVEENRFAERITIRAGDLRQIRDIFSPGQFQRVLANPPFYKLGEGRCSEEPQQAVARHEVEADIGAVADAASGLLQRGGKVDLVYPATRLVDLLAALRTNDLEPKRLQVVYSYPESPARLVLVEAQKGSGAELVVLEPFFIYREKGGAYSFEMSRCYSP